MVTYWQGLVASNGLAKTGWQASWLVSMKSEQARLDRDEERIQTRTERYFQLILHDNLMHYMLFKNS